MPDVVALEAQAVAVASEPLRDPGAREVHRSLELDEPRPEARHAETGMDDLHVEALRVHDQHRNVLRRDARLLYQPFDGEAGHVQLLHEEERFRASNNLRMPSLQSCPRLWLWQGTRQPASTQTLIVPLTRSQLLVTHPSVSNVLKPKSRQARSETLYKTGWSPSQSPATMAVMSCTWLGFM
eukprot:CAMPEP_0171079808 /NCGR_PEP_ID=MMETSP0766_2-20121228/15484_1 /TAXON_ID=439317 /ORGANISM="Gambierdiscus australes, Strain CAWD 149" /LENGTH=181 /DNA_ID=CAMNT_0011537019 /DNA_START=106 /DNA_END=649 /DNA_ORIENTATION=+